MNPEQVGERLRLGLAQLRKLRRDVGHRAVVLAQLSTGADMLSRRSVALAAQRIGQGFDSRCRVCQGEHRLAVPADQVDHPLLGEGTNRVLTAAFGHETQRGHRQVVVGVPEASSSGGSQQVHLRRATPAPPTTPRGGTAEGLPVGQQGVEVTPHRGRAQPERLGDLGRRHRAVFEQLPGHRLAGTAFCTGRQRCLRLTTRPDVFHNTDVTYFLAEVKYLRPRSSAQQPVAAPILAVRTATLPAW